MPSKDTMEAMSEEPLIPYPSPAVLAPGGPSGIVTSLRMVAFDIDGVVLRGDTVLPAAPHALADVIGRGLLLRYVTNNSTRHRVEVAERLESLGLPAEPGMVLTSAAATASYLRAEFGEGASVLVVGGDGLVAELRDAGLEPRPVRSATQAPGAAPQSETPQPSGIPAPPDITANSDVPVAVVVGLDVGFDYATLAAAQAAIRGGAHFIATNADATFPVEGGVLPGGGAIVAAIAVASQQEPLVIGKPHLGLARALVDEAGGDPAAVLFVGDRLDTDIGMAAAAGMRSALVLTGVTARADLDRPGVARPDFVLETLADLSGVLDGLLADERMR